jgi:hypothetical protein
MSNQSASVALLVGFIALAVFFSPFFIYLHEVKEKSMQKGGSPSQGDFMQIVFETLGLHIGIVFFAVVLLGAVDILMRPVPDWQPSQALIHFFQLNSSGGNFIDTWMHLSASPEDTAAGSALNESLVGVLKATGLVLAVLFLAIPIILVVLALRAMMKDNLNQGNDSALGRAAVGMVFFAGATVLVWMHALISSGLVIALTGKDFSYWNTMTDLWHRIIF